MLTPAAAYADIADRLTALRAQASAAYRAYARDPGLVGPVGTHLAYWAAAYEVRAALAEQNPAFAQTLLPPAGAAYAAGPGLPLLPAGVRWAVDEARPDSLTLTVDVAGPLTLSVTAPGTTQPVAAVVSQGTSRATATVDAPADGLYYVFLTTAAVRLVTLLVPVQRAEFRRFRENSRALAFAWGRTLPRPHGPYSARLARLIGAEAAARTGQAALFAALAASAAAVPVADSPLAIYLHA